MKRILYITLIILLAGCAKQQITEPVNIPKDTVIRHMNMPYHYNIAASNTFMHMQYSGKKDALGKIEMKGYMKLGNEKINYDVYYDGKWYDRKTGEVLQYDNPINPVEFISMLIVSDTLKNPSIRGNKMVFNDTVNTVFISPMDYMHMGEIITDVDGNLQSITVQDNIKLHVELNKDNSIYIMPKRKVLKTISNTFSTDADIMRKRLETTGSGTVKGDILLFREMDENINMLLDEQHVYAGIFQYTQPMMDENEKYINGNRKNTAIITDTLGIFMNEGMIPYARGPYTDIVIESSDYEYMDNMCIFTEQYIFRIEQAGNNLVIKDIPRFLSQYIYALIKYQ